MGRKKNGGGGLLWWILGGGAVLWLMSGSSASAAPAPVVRRNADGSVDVTSGMGQYLDPSIEQKIIRIISKYESNINYALINKSHIEFSYGVMQTRLLTGGIKKLLELYASLGGQYASQFEAFGDLQSESLRDNSQFYSLLQEAAKDPIMQKAQDLYFLREFLYPGFEYAKNRGWQYPVSYLVAADSSINSGPDLMRRLMDSHAQGSDELSAIRNYINWRERWLVSTFQKKGLSAKSIDYAAYQRMGLMRKFLNECPNLDCNINFRGTSL